MNSPLVLAVIGAVATLGAGAGLASLLTLRVTKRKLLAEADGINASTAAALSTAAREMLVPLQTRVHELEAEATGARRELTAARDEISDLRTVVAELTSTLRTWRAAILDPAASVDRLRAMVSNPGTNGR